MNLRVTIAGTQNAPRKMGGASQIRARASAATDAAASEREASSIRSASDDERAISRTNHARWRRWTISAVIVMLLHGAIAAGVVIWRKTPQSAPVIIELAPGSVSVVPATELPDARPKPAPSNQATTGKDDKNPAVNDADAAARPVPAPREAATPPAGADANSEPRALPAPGATSAPATGNNPSMSGPIDLVVPNRRPADQKGPFAQPHRPGLEGSERARAQKGAVFRRPSNVTARHSRALMGNAPGAAPVRNAAGLPVQAPAGVPSEAGRNAAGLPLPAPAGISGGDIRNAIGLPVPTAGAPHGGASGTTTVSRGAATKPVGAGGAALNATGMATRQGLGAAAIGGPARRPTTGLNGSDFNARRP